MYSNMKIVILILLLFTGGSVIKAQRHYCIFRWIPVQHFR